MEPDTYIAIYDEYVGTGSTLNSAYADLKGNIMTIEDEDEIKYYKAYEIKVAHQIVEIPPYEPYASNQKILPADADKS